MNEEIERINLDDYIQTGEGGTAITYNNKNGKTLAKLFLPGIAANTCEQEFHINQVVYESGIPTPKPIRLITDGTRFGAEYELISPKRSFTRIISQEPDKLVAYSERFAVLARQIHETPADTKQLPDMKEKVGYWIDQCQGLPDAFKERFHKFLDTVRSTPYCLHGDLHIGNIITDGKRDLWIDVGDFAYGVPQWDLGMMYHATHFLTPERTDNLFHLDPPTLKAHWDAFAPAYYGTDDKEELEAEVKKLYPYAAAKIIYVLSRLTNGRYPISESLLQMIDKYLA